MKHSLYRSEAEKYMRCKTMNPTNQLVMYLLCDHVGHRDVLAIPMCGNLGQHFLRHEFLVVREIVAMHNGGLREHDRVHPTPPGILPIQIALVARDDVVRVHTRRKSNQNTVRGLQKTGIG